MRYILTTTLLIAALLVGCSDDNNGTPGPGTYTPADSIWEDGSGGWFARLDATSSDANRYFNFATREVVNLTDDQAGSSSDWHLGWSRVNGKLNGGTSGPLGVKAVDLADVGDPNATDFDAMTAVPQVAEDQWEEDAVNLVFSPWFTYDPVQHSLAPTRNLFVMKTAAGNYAKVVVDSLKEPGMPPDMGTIGLKFVYQPDGSPDLSGAAQYVEIDGTSGSVFFSFAQGGAAEVSDPASSTIWDIWFDAYDAKVNNTIHGPGEAAVYPMYLETNKFDSVTTAPTGTGGGGYFSDGVSSVFGVPTDPESAWYDYNPLVHEIISRGHVYIVRLPDDTYYKMAITNYYLVVEGDPVSGWLTLRFAEL